MLITSDSYQLNQRERDLVSWFNNDQRLIKLRPDDPSLLLTLGQVEYFSGDTGAAITAYQHFLELAPDDPSAPLVKQELKRLTSAVPQGTG